MSTVTKTFHLFDTFGEAAPSLNLGGRKKITTCAGASASIIVFALTLCFGILKL